jgi:hypothetical protein
MRYFLITFLIILQYVICENTNKTCGIYNDNCETIPCCKGYRCIFNNFDNHKKCEEKKCKIFSQPCKEDSNCCIDFKCVKVEKDNISFCYFKEQKVKDFDIFIKEIYYNESISKNCSSEFRPCFKNCCTGLTCMRTLGGVCHKISCKPRSENCIKDEECCKPLKCVQDQKSLFKTKYCINPDSLLNFI